MRAVGCVNGWDVVRLGFVVVVVVVCFMMPEAIAHGLTFVSSI